MRLRHRIEKLERARRGKGRVIFLGPDLDAEDNKPESVEDALVRLGITPGPNDEIIQFVFVDEPTSE